MMRPWYGFLTHDSAPAPAWAQATPHDELRSNALPGLPASAGSAPTRLLEIFAPTRVFDDRGTPAGWLMPGQPVPVAKGIGAAGQVVHVITHGRHAGRVIYRHGPTFRARPVALAWEESIR